MYSVNVSVVGIAPLLQHAYPMPDFSEISKGGKIATGEKDFSQEWHKYFYVNSENQVYQPASHFEGCMVRAASGFKIQGQRGKTYSQLFRGNVFITPDEILHGITKPDTLDFDADKTLYLDMRPVPIQRARIIRIRPCFKSGWKLEFEITVLDDQIPHNVLNEVLALAGKSVGVGDFRPKFGRFMVTQFSVNKNGN